MSDDKIIDYVREILKPVRKIPTQYRTFSALEQGNLQIDLAVFASEAHKNKNYAYAMVIIDIYSRYVWVYPLKRKTATETGNALKDWIERNSILIQPRTITTDSGKEWMGDFNKEMKKNDIYHNKVQPNDHRSMAIVDAFIRNMRNWILEYWLKDNDLNWISHIDEIVNKYNTERIHSGIKTTPYKALTGETQPFIKEDRFIQDLKEGDFVRIKIPKNIYDKKSSTQNWSSEVYKIAKIDGGRYILEDKAGRFPRYDLLKSKFRKLGSDNVLPQRKEAQLQRALINMYKREDIKEDNIQREKRDRKQVDKGFYIS